MGRHCLGHSLGLPVAEQWLTSEPCSSICFPSRFHGREVNVEPRPALPTSTIARGPHAPRGAKEEGVPVRESGLALRGRLGKPWPSQLSLAAHEAGEILTNVTDTGLGGAWSTRVSCPVPSGPGECLANLNCSELKCSETQGIPGWETAENGPSGVLRSGSPALRQTPVRGLLRESPPFEGGFSTFGQSQFPQGLLF